MESYQPTAHSELSFQLGDVITVTDIDLGSGRYFGHRKLTHQQTEEVTTQTLEQGWFPKSIVKKLDRHTFSKEKAMEAKKKQEGAGQKWIVALDGSAESQGALRHCCNLANDQDCVYLLHVIDKRIVKPKDIEKQEKEGRVYIDQAEIICEEIQQKRQVHLDIQRKLRRSNQDVSEEICSMAKWLQADYVVVGCRGIGKLQDLLLRATKQLGSVSEYVVRHSPCPVLVVRNTEHT